MIYIGQTSRDDVIGFTEDGMAYFQDKPPTVVVDHVRRVYFSRPIWGTVVCYYDAYTERIVELLANEPWRSCKITQFIPEALMHLMTSTTPFECSDPTLTLCARSYIWRFKVGGIFKDRTRILPDNAAQHFNMNQIMTTMINNGRIYVYQNNVILRVDLDAAQAYRFYTYPQSMTIIAIAYDVHTMRNNITGNVYTHDRIEGWRIMPSNYDQYGVCDHDYGLANDRLTVLDSEDIIPKSLAVSYDVEF